MWTLFFNQRIFRFFEKSFFSSFLAKNGKIHPNRYGPIKNAEKIEKFFWPSKSKKNGLKIILKQKKKFFFSDWPELGPISETYFPPNIGPKCIFFFAKSPKTPGNVCPYKKCRKNRKIFFLLKIAKKWLKNDF